jgi:hypothetical protein
MEGRQRKEKAVKRVVLIATSCLYAGLGWAGGVYVAPNGNDANPGTKAKPFATLQRARDAARMLEADGDRRIVVRGGTYYDVSLVLEPADSGLAIEAAPGETPVLYGGRRVTGWHRDGKKFYAAKLPGVKEGTWDFRVLVVRTALRPRARLPKSGIFKHLSRFDARWHTTSGGGFRGADKPHLKTRLKYRKGDLGPWLDVKNAELTVYHQWDDSVVGLKAHDPGTQTLTFSNPSGYPPGAFGVRTYTVWNVREGMHEPGQWYLDRTRGMLVYWPLPGEDMAKTEVVAPTTEAVIRIQGAEKAPVKSVRLRGLALSATTTPLVAGGWAAGRFMGAVELKHVSDGRLLDLRISAVGGQGIRARNCSRLTIQGCEVTDAGAGGIYDVCGSENRILDNRVRRIGRTYASAIGIRTTGGGQKRPELSHDNVIAHNEVLQTPYVGIEFDGWKNRFEYNVVSEPMQVLNDGAAFYGAGRENVLRGNVARDVPSGKLAAAYYIDELGKDILVEGNLAVGCGWPFLMHMASDNVLRNNVFYCPRNSYLRFGKSKNFVVEKNVIHAEGNIAMHGPGLNWKNNLAFSRNGGYRGLPGSTAKGDPLFVDPAKNDFRFKPGSPALKLGIKPLDVSDVGPRPAEKRGATDD